MKEKKAEVLGLTRNNDRYRNVPDDLKWAIPLIEIQRTPEFLEQQRIQMILSTERVKKEMAAKRQPFQLIINSEKN